MTGRTKGKRTEHPYREADFQSYVTWKSLPSLLRSEKEETLRKLGFEDDNILVLLKIRSQKEFAGIYKISQKCLSDWNLRIDEKDLLKDARKKYFRKLMSNVITAVYRKTLSEGDAQRGKFLAQYLEDFEERTQQRSPQLDQLTELLTKMAAKKR